MPERINHLRGAGDLIIALREIEVRDSIAQHSLVQASLTEKHQEQLRLIAKTFNLPCAQTALDALTNGEFIEALKTNKPVKGSTSPLAQPAKQLTNAEKCKRHRQKKKEEAQRAIHATSAEESVNDTTPTAKRPKSLTPPSPEGRSGHREVDGPSATGGVIKQGRKYPIWPLPDGEGCIRTQRRQRKRKAVLAGLESSDAVSSSVPQIQCMGKAKKAAREEMRGVLTKYQSHLSKPGESVDDTDMVLRTLLASGKREGKLVRNFSNALPNSVADELRKEGEDNLKKRMRDGESVAHAMLKAKISHDQYGSFFDNLLPGEKNLKAGRSTIVSCRQAMGDLMNVMNPIEETPGKAGYACKPERFFEMMLPEYFDRCARYMFADGDEEMTIIYPVDPTLLTEDEVLATGDAQLQEEQVNICHH